jgi:hypothetical protein
MLEVIGVGNEALPYSAILVLEVIADDRQLCMVLKRQIRGIVDIERHGVFCENGIKRECSASWLAL